MTWFTFVFIHVLFFTILLFLTLNLFLIPDPQAYSKINI